MADLSAPTATAAILAVKPLHDNEPRVPRHWRRQTGVEPPAALTDSADLSNEPTATPPAPHIDTYA